MPASNTPLICPPIQAGATSQTVYFQITGGSSGLPTTGLLFNSVGLQVTYVTTRGPKVTVPLVSLAAIDSPYLSGGFREVDPLGMPGWYRLDIPNSALVGPGPKDLIIVAETPAGFITSADYGCMLIAIVGGTLTNIDTTVDSIGSAVTDLDTAVDNIGAHFPPIPSPTIRTDS